MRVAFDARSLAAPALRGWDRYTVELARALAGANVAILFLHRAGSPPAPHHLTGLPVTTRAVAGRGGLWWEQVSVPRALRALGADLYHAPAEHGVPLVASRPTVLTVHSVTAHSYRDLLRRGTLRGTLADYLGPGRDARRRPLAGLYWRLQVARATHLMVPSAFTREEIVHLLGVTPNRITVTPLAPAPAFRETAPDAERRRATLARLGVTPPYLLYVGGYERHKNVEGLLEVFARVRRQRPDLSLVTVGTGSPPHSSQLTAHSRGLESRTSIVFLHDVTADLVDLYDGADALVTLSWRESFGLPALEAMTRGVPVVASAWGAAPEVVGDAGRLVDPRDVDGAARAVLDVLDPAQRAALAERGRRHAARFTWAETARRTLDVYRRLLA